MPFSFDMHGAIAIVFAPEKADEIEAMLVKAIEDLRELPPTDVAAGASTAIMATPRTQQAPGTAGSQGIRPPPSPNSVGSVAQRPAGAPAPPPLVGAIPGIAKLSQPDIKPPPAPLFSNQPAQPQHPLRSQAVVPFRQPGNASARAAMPPMPRPMSGRIRLGAGKPEEVAARAAAEAQAMADAAAAAQPAAPPALPTADAMPPMAARGGGASPGPNQSTDGRLINPDTGLPYKPATHDENGKPIVVLPQPPPAPPPPPPK
jgi:hypothetical protein